ncbi:MepB family protein [Rhodococcus sp. KBS0724]|uniref:MepB family protein n=1 Tax=Rhodococcus sp. KBS0724 TaxID=1179674 RepID=UPI0021B15491|nr:MepB family protein [Rhodococcus sp. KBS0724]
MNADGCTWSTPIPEPEGTVYRRAKTTPTKLGQFVTLWQRSDAGPIRPFDVSDGVELFVVEVYNEEQLGHFIFPVDALVRRGVVSTDFAGGKRAIRVYPPWVTPTSAQALKTQSWQLEFFRPTLCN